MRVRRGGAFGRLWWSMMSAYLADALVWTAAPLLAVRLTQDPFAVSAISAASYLPWLLFGVAAGVAADRFDRRRLLGVANVARAGVVLGAAALAAAGRMPVWGLVVLIFVAGVLETVAEEGNQALLPRVVEPSGRDAANSRVVAGTQVAQGLVAPSAAAALVAVAAAAPFVVSGVAFAAAAVLALLLPRTTAARTEAVPRAPRGGFFRQLDDGARFLWRDRPLRTLLLVTTGSATCLTLAQAALVVFVVRTLHVPDALVGVFLAVGALGSVAASALLAPAVRRIGRPWVLAGAGLVCGPPLVVFGVVPGSRAGVVVGAVAYATMSLGVAVWNSLTVSVRQHRVPDDLLGRVSGTWRTVCWVLVPLVTLAGGALARVDLRLPLVLGGVLATILAVLTARPVVRAVAAATDGGAAGPADDDAGAGQPELVGAVP
ncbi:MFS transporter [Luteimicrobium sp. DT211]|uniref:MFS transporter n=1 Tax=Luteimicrobium sp. DT211 TaxID=3393412 RepID=UPI003CEDCF62